MTPTNSNLGIILRAVGAVAARMSGLRTRAPGSTRPKADDRACSTSCRAGRLTKFDPLWIDRASREAGEVMSIGPARSALSTLAACLSLCAGVANAQTIICHESIAVKASTGRVLPLPDINIYYKLSPNSIRRWNPAKSEWEEDFCLRQGWTCTINNPVYTANGTDVGSDGERIDQSISIDLQAGSLRITVNSGAFESRGAGKCEASSDPAEASTPKRP
jgi:hypothetical protein